MVLPPDTHRVSSRFLLSSSSSSEDFIRVRRFFFFFGLNTAGSGCDSDMTGLFFFSFLAPRINLPRFWAASLDLFTMHMHQLNSNVLTDEAVTLVVLSQAKPNVDNVLAFSNSKCSFGKSFNFCAWMLRTKNRMFTTHSVWHQCNQCLIQLPFTTPKCTSCLHIPISKMYNGINGVSESLIQYSMRK